MSKADRLLDHHLDYALGEASKFGYLIAVSGVFALLSPLFYTAQVSPLRIYGVGLTAVLVGLGMKWSFSGLQIDFASRQIRYYKAIFGIKRGEWKALPVLHKVVLTAENVSFWNTPNGISPTFKTHLTTYTVCLFDQADQPLHFMQTNDRKQAQQLADRIATQLEIPSDTLV